MSRLYVANTTKQKQIIYFRLDFRKDGQRLDDLKPKPANQSPTIPPGQQIVLGGDLHISQIESIVDQLNRYGMIGVTDMARINSIVGAVPYVFNIDAPVPASVIRDVLLHNNGVLVASGQTRREQAALSASTIAENAGNAGQFEVEIVQEEQGTEADEGRLEEGFKVPRTVDEVPLASRRKPGRPRKAA